MLAKEVNIFHSNWSYWNHIDLVYFLGWTPSVSLKPASVTSKGRLQNLLLLCSRVNTGHRVYLDLGYRVLILASFLFALTSFSLYLILFGNSFFLEPWLTTTLMIYRKNWTSDQKRETSKPRKIQLSQP